MSVDSIRAYTNKMYEQLILNKTDRRIEELRIEERRVKHLREVSEEARIEMNRRMKVPERIVELLDDLYTLTDLPVKDWTVEVGDEEYEADPEILKQVITISPHQYREEVEVEDEEELNEMRERAGLGVKAIHANKQDAELKAFKAMAGL